MELSIKADLFDPAKHTPRFDVRDFNREILVLEDDLALQTVVCRILKAVDPDANIRWVTTLGAAYKRVNEDKFEGAAYPSLILSDIYLPNFELGTSLFEKCKRVYPDVPFAFMSSMPADEYIDIMGRRADAPPFIAKPFSVKECKQTLSALLRN